MTPTIADECARVLEILASAPSEGLTQDAIVAETGWPYRAVNGLLVDLVLSRRVSHSKVRDKKTRKNAVHYALYSRGA